MKKRANNLDRIIDFESEEKLAAEVKDVKPFHADSDDINDYDNDDDDLDVSNDRKVQQAKERLQKLQREKEEKERIEKEKKEKELQEKLEKEKQQKQKEQEEKELRLKQEKENKEKQEQENQEKERKEKERKEKEHREQESKQRERIEKEKKEKELQEKLEKEKQQKQKEQEEEKEKELRLKQEKENKEKQEKERKEKERKEKEQKEKQNYSYSHNGNNHNNHKGGHGNNYDDNNHKGGYGQQDDDDDNHKGGYGNQGDDDNNHKGGYGHHDDDGYGHKGGYGHQDDDDGYGHKGHKGGYGHHDDDDDGYKGHKGGYGHHDDDDGYGHHGKKCNSNLDCTHLTSSLCSKGVCVGGYCQKSSTNVTHLECCRDEDCNKRTDWNLDKRINSRDYPELEECNAGKCQGGVFNDKGELITSPTCSRRENCCINKEWDNYCNWPGGQATWTREACKGENCQVSTWGAIYSYPIPRHTPNFPDIVPRFLFKKNWVSLYKKLIIVALNVENQFNIKKIFIQRSQSTLVSKLNEIEDFLKSACSIWRKLDPQCSIPDGITPFPFIGLLDFTNSPKFSQYDHFLDSILSGNYSGLPFCSHNHHY